MKAPLLFFSLALASCQPETKTVNLLNLDDDTAFPLCEVANLPINLSVSAALDTVSETGLLLSLELENKSNHAITFFGDQALLLLDDGRTYAPESSFAQPLTFKPAEIKALQWKYSPINNLSLHHRINMAGAYLPRYRILLKTSNEPGISHTDTLSFCMPNAQYAKYTQKQKKLLPKIYTAITNNAMVERQQAYWQNQTGEIGTAQLSENEYFVGGVNMRHVVYHRADSLYLELRLVNHSPEAIYVEPKSIFLSMHGQILLPQSLPATDPIIMRKGDRWQGKWVYHAANFTDSLQIEYNGILLYRNTKPWLADKVVYQYID